MKRGIFITFEGPEGSGKSTQVNSLVNSLSKIGIDVLTTREPGGTRLGEVLRDILKCGIGNEQIFPEAEALLFAASRAQLVREVIIPTIEEGKWVISDRFADSTTVYQGMVRGLGIDKMLSINSLAIDEAVPDLTILIDIDVRHGFERVRKRSTVDGYDRIEKEDISFHEKIRAGYLELVKMEPERFEVVNGDNNEAVVKDDIWNIVRRYLYKTP